MASASRKARTLNFPLCTSCRAAILQKPAVSRPFSRTALRSDDLLESTMFKTQSSSPVARAQAATSPSRNAAPIRQSTAQPQNQREARDDALTALLSTMEYDPKKQRELEETSEGERDFAKTSHFHVYATKHNTHITITTPDRKPLLSLSAGNLGFKKANRGTYDAAYQLASYVLGRIREQGWMKNKIMYFEVILRGFGVGREAVTKSLMGVEGQGIRNAIVRISDNTKLKFGGTRSRKPRRLG